MAFGLENQQPLISMDIAKLKQFLVNAKKNTYASGGESKAKTFFDGTKEYIFNEGNLKYVDRYKGHEEFNGEENIFKNLKQNNPEPSS